jgi:hypothetical protein
MWGQLWPSPLGPVVLPCGQPGLPGHSHIICLTPGGCVSLTESGAYAAKNVLDPVHLIQGLHCILGKVVLQMTARK